MRTAIRFLMRYKSFSIINIAGLAIGMVCCILILLWVQDELSYDRFNKNGRRIYRVYHHLTMGGNLRRAPMTSPPMGPAMEAQIPEVSRSVRISPPNRRTVTFGDASFHLDAVSFADNSLFEVFTFPLIKGDPATVLENPYTAVLSEEQAERIFGQEDAVGKIVKLDGEMEFTVTGVMENIPGNSHISFDMLCSFETFNAQNRPEMNIWGWFGYYTYLMLDEAGDPKVVEEKITALVNDQMGERMRANGSELLLFLQPLYRIHLYSDLESDTAAAGDISYVYLFSGIALFILLIACINFINMATARAGARAKEVGMRKTLGAQRNKLVMQFIGESILYGILALFLTIFLLEVALPYFNQLTGRELELNYFSNFWLIPGFLLLVLIIGIFAGLYPALYLSSFHPIEVLKGGVRGGVSAHRFRKILVLVQFIISITLIIGTITIHNQVTYMKNKKLGFDKEHTIVIPDIADLLQPSSTTLREEIASVPGVTGVSTASTALGRQIEIAAFLPEGFPENETQLMFQMDADENFIPMLGIELVEGRNFDPKVTTDVRNAAIINLAAANKFSWENPIGKTIERTLYGSQGPSRENVTVIGVVKDFHLASLHSAIEPLFIGNIASEFNVLFVKAAGNDLHATVSRIEEKWKDFAPNKPFDYYFLDESYERQYEGEERVGQISLSFCLLAIFIGSLGLFALSAFAAEQRTKEIGVRKVLGASVSGVVGLLSREAVVLVVLANVVAWPLAWYLMSQWLQNFAYQVGVQIWVFIAAGLAAAIIAFVTVSFQAVKTALTNPADSLRYE